MNRIKNIEDVIIGDAEVLMEIITKKSDIVLTDENLSDSQSTTYGIVVATGSAVNDLVAGDIVVRTRVSEMTAYSYGEKTIGILARYNISIAVKPDNFNPNAEISA